MAKQTPFYPDDSPFRLPAVSSVPEPAYEPLFSPDPAPKPRRRPTVRKAAAEAPAKTIAKPIFLPADPPQEITPVQTRYAGCHFRSRLEARTAVWFDHLGIRWQYEADTYRIGDGEARRGYLPDFYLADDEVWVEVKGAAHQVDHGLLDAAAHPDHGLPLTLAELPDEWPVLKTRMVILGPVPQLPGFLPGLVVLLGRQVARQLLMVACEPSAMTSVALSRRDHRHCLVPVGHPTAVESLVRFEGPLGAASDGLFDEFGFAAPCGQIGEAYTAARSARFEHGQNG